MSYVTGYQNAFLRFLHSFFVQMPLTLWFKYLSYPLAQNVLAAKYLDVWFAARAAIATSSFPATAATGGLIYAADPRAKALTPFGITVIAVPDEPIANLIKIDPAWGKDKDPSGAILQDNGFSYSTVHAFTMCGKHARVYAAASEIPAVLQYEFENIILQRLGYDVSNR